MFNRDSARASDPAPFHVLMPPGVELLRGTARLDLRAVLSKSAVERPRPRRRTAERSPVTATRGEGPFRVVETGSGAKAVRSGLFTEAIAL